MAESPEDPLTRGLVEGREDAYAALYDRFGSSLFHVARAALWSREEAEDAVQEVFLGLVRARKSLSAVRNLRAYLFAALHHALRQRAAFRQRQRTGD
jgi:RNA polymerase sigma-70 factor (ECF subfamily)